ncbi:MAG: T9SS type A sorting domain-containing protein, partial [Bacteroidetes bacterium]|nr:T9SS type A sorting domain-containing protein [Bacteroidota bacterium]
PNPFVGSTEIPYELGLASDVTIDIKDLTGRVVMQIDEGTQPAGQHNFVLNATQLEAGVYFYTLKAGQFQETKRMIIN